MTLRFKKPRPLNRQLGAYRDSRLFVIATEDTHAPKNYFDENFQSPRVHVAMLPTEDGSSSPQHVLDRLNEFQAEFDLNDDDELWLILDTDHWVEPNHLGNFKQVCSEAANKGYQLAHSNPCFEIWLLLHWEDIAFGQHFSCAKDVVRHLKKRTGRIRQAPQSSVFSRGHRCRGHSRAKTRHTFCRAMAAKDGHSRLQDCGKAALDHQMTHSTLALGEASFFAKVASARAKAFSALRSRTTL